MIFIAVLFILIPTKAVLYSLFIHLLMLNRVDSTRFNMTCGVHWFKSNYSDKVGYVPMFSFPTDNGTREKWFRAIPR